MADDRFIDKELRDDFHDGRISFPPAGSHPTLPVAFGDQAALIDEELAPLVFLLWKQGVRTTENCQDLYLDGTAALLGFSDAKDLRLYLQLAAPLDMSAGSLYDRATGALDPNVPEGGIWRYMLTPRALGHFGEDRPKGVTLYRLPASVVFPRSDLRQVIVNAQKAYDSTYR